MKEKIYSKKMKKKNPSINKIISRKNNHLSIAINSNIESEEKSWFKHIELIHQALPEMNFNQIDTSVEYFSHGLNLPLIISALTGGTEQGERINKKLAISASKNKIGMSVGSQRIALEHPRTIRSFKIARRFGEDIPIIANLGLAQLIEYINFDQVEKIMKMVEANAIAIHLNSLQELIQPEGDTNFKNGLDKIIALNDFLDIPLIVKETGSGISKELAHKLFESGIKIIDVAGSGGSSFSLIEQHRKFPNDQNFKKKVGLTFANWGIPSAASIMEVKKVSEPDHIIIGSGGIRTGLDIAKALSIGANLTSIGLPFLKLAGSELRNNLDAYIKELDYGLKTAMFLTGCKNIHHLQQVQKIIYPPLLTWKNNRI